MGPNKSYTTNLFEDNDMNANFDNIEHNSRFYQKNFF